MKQSDSLIVCLALLTGICSVLWSCTEKSPNPEINRQIGGRCEDCEIFYVDIPSSINWQTDIAGVEPGDKLEIAGTILKFDGITPAADIIMYLYQTNMNGYYTPTLHQNPNSTKHGRIRGWVKTNSFGKYNFITVKPGIYPDSTVPAHIHPIIKEAGKSVYYIDDYVFNGEYKVDNSYKSREERRCGSGIINLTRDSTGTWRGTRNLILGLNIPNY